jgi:lipoyl(octanoyl) transferase
MCRGSGILAGMQAELLNLCKVYQLGLVPYLIAWEMQEQLTKWIAGGSHLPALLLLEHPHIFTFGRRGNPNNLLWNAQECSRRGVEVLWVDRGGDVTYHGPGQLVGYPLLPLAPGGLNSNQVPVTNSESTEAIPKVDYVGYIRKLEETIILALARLGIASERIAGKTGVWVQPGVQKRGQNCKPELRNRPAKIAAIGVKVDARGVSHHGFALNVDPDMSFYEGIISCGLAELPVVSLAEIINPAPSLDEVATRIFAAFGEVFGYQMVACEPSETFFGVSLVETR